MGGDKEGREHIADSKSGYEWRESPATTASQWAAVPLFHAKTESIRARGMPAFVSARTKKQYTGTR